MDVTMAAKWLIVAGLSLAFVGLLVLLAGKTSFIGRLPGDIKIERQNFTFYFPIVTCLLVSALMTVIFWLIARFK